jgi:predicted nucleotide-binding protein with TIR-like domain
MARTRTPSKKPAELDGEPELLVPRTQFEEALTDRITSGQELRDREIRDENEMQTVKEAFRTWDEFNLTLLRRSFSTARPAETYDGSVGIFVLGGGPDPLPTRVKELRDDLTAKLRRLKSLKEQLPLYDSGKSQLAPATLPSAPRTGVFVVHGHHEALKQQVARTVERLTGASPIILHEQADGGRTIIEKFESYTNEVGFAVLHVEGVELPSDMSGVLYTPADEAGAWQLKLAREMKAADIPVDLNKLT